MSKSRSAKPREPSSRLLRSASRTGSRDTISSQVPQDSIPSEQSQPSHSAPLPRSTSFTITLPPLRRFHPYQEAEGVKTRGRSPTRRDTEHLVSQTPPPLGRKVSEFVSQLLQGSTRCAEDENQDTSRPGRQPFAHYFGTSNASNFTSNFGPRCKCSRLSSPA